MKDQKINSVNFFIVTMSLLIIFFLIGFIKDDHGNQSEVFFVKSANYMADYYNVAKASADRNPYFSDFKGSYFPISYILMYLMSRFSTYYRSTGFEAFHRTMGLASASYFIFIISSTFFLILSNQIFESKAKKYWIIFVLMVSGIFLFSFERGNLIILAAVLSSVFIFYYKSRKKFYKEIALLSLAIAAALKGYPALLGMLLLYEKNYKEAARLLLYGFIFSILPFFFINGGLANVAQFYSNIQLSNNGYLYGFNGDPFPRFGYYYFLPYWHKLPFIGSLITKETLHAFLSPIMSFISLIALGLNFTEKTMWKKIGVLVCVLILLPVNSALYCGLYMFPVIILFINQKPYKKKDFFYMILFILFLNPFQIKFGTVNFTTAFTNLSVFVLFFSLLLEQVNYIKPVLQIFIKKRKLVNENKSN